MLRLFFALWPDAPVRAALAGAAAAFATDDGRAVPPVNYHLTLAFLGDVEPSRLPALERAAHAVDVDPFTLTLDEVGRFERAGVRYLGASTPPSGLVVLRGALVSALAGSAGLELPPDVAGTRFVPHVTVARHIPRGEAAGEPRGPLPIPVLWPVSGFVLMASDRARAGGAYEVIGAWPKAS